MKNVNSNFEVDNKSTDHSTNARDKAMPSFAINDKHDNGMLLRIRERQSRCSLRSTYDSNNTFAIDMGSNIEIVDRRPGLASTRSKNLLESGLENSLEKIPHRHAYDVLASEKASRLHTSNVLDPAAEKFLNASEISKRTDLWIDHNLTRLHKTRDQMTEYEYRGQVASLVKFRNNMHEFSATAAEKGLKAADVEKTFQQIRRLMLDDAAGPLDRETRRSIAEQIMNDAAHPTSIDQGNHKTCMEAALESLMFTRHPGDAAKLIADIALTGTFVSEQKFSGADGKMSALKVNLNPEPDNDACEFQDPEDPHGRSFADEIFQTTAVNLFYANQDNLFHTHQAYLEKSPLEQYKDFLSTEDSADTGERIVDTRTGKPIEPEIRSPNVPSGGLAVMARAIAGDDNFVEKEIVNNIWYRDGSESTVGINTLKELENTLSLLKNEHRLPVMIRVNVNCEPFYMDSRLSKVSGAIGGAHAVTVRDFDASTGAVMIDNEWGDDVDHLSKNPINARDLFVATLPNTEAAKVLEQMIDDDKRNGRFDPLKHMQQLRLSNLAYELPDDAYAHSVREEVRAAAGRWNGLPPREQSAERSEIIAMTRDLDAAPRSEALAEVFHSGIIPEKQYIDERADFALDCGISTVEEILPPASSPHATPVGQSH